MSTDNKTNYIQRLTAVRTELKTLVNTLTEEQLNSPVITEGNTWTVLNILAHLAENERGMSIHVYKIRNGRETVPEDFDVQQWNAGLKDRFAPSTLSEVLKTLDDNRAKTLEILESLGDEEWSLQGRHPVRGMISIAQFYETMAGHDRHHLQDIKKGLGLV